MRVQGSLLAPSVSPPIAKRCGRHVAAPHPALWGEFKCGITFLRGLSGNFARSTTKLCFDANGVLRTVPANALALTYRYVNGAWVAQGVSVETTRTNYMTYNRDFANAAWSKTNITAVRDAVGLDGAANSASTLTATAAGGTVGKVKTLVSSTYTTSFYVKRKTGSGAIQITDDNVNFTTLSGLSSTAWTRYQITRTQANPVVGFKIATSGDAIEVDFGQLEAGGFATSPIETAGTTVTRAVDLFSILETGWANLTAGSFVVAYKVPTVPADASGFLFELSVASNDTVSSYLNATESKIRGQIATSGVLQFNEVAADILVGDADARFAIGYAESDTRLYSNGVASALDTSILPPSVFTQLTIGHRDNNDLQLNSTIKHFAYFDNRLPDYLLKRLTE